MVGFHDVRDRFQFKTVRIGKWVDPAEKEDTAPRFYDALCDLMAILSVPESVISLRQTLSLDYGTGGQYGVAAHYTPSTRAFALAKNAGPGSIAHEWFHAFDHYIADKAFQNTSALQFASSAFVKNKPKRSHSLNSLLFRCFDEILLNDSNSPSESRTSSDYAQIAQQKDKELGQRYYSLPYELCARAFEAFVQDSTIKNNFLVKGTKQSSEAEQGLYPTGYHRVKINRAFTAYFSALGQAVLTDQQRHKS